MAVVMRVSIDDKGNIAKVEDKNGNKISKLTPAKHKNKLKGKKILAVKNLSVIQSNPCVCIQSGGGGYWVCW
jgi:hypothetical protein